MEAVAAIDTSEQASIMAQSGLEPVPLKYSYDVPRIKKKAEAVYASRLEDVKKLLVRQEKDASAKKQAEADKLSAIAKDDPALRLREFIMNEVNGSDEMEVEADPDDENTNDNDNAVARLARPAARRRRRG